MARRSTSSERSSRSTASQRSPGREDRPERTTFDLTEDHETPKGVWCIVASIISNQQDGANRGGDLEPGSTVYCFPPMRGGAFESVEVVGPNRKTGKLAASVIAASDLTAWKALNVTDPAVLEQISPPWDSSHVSQNVAEGIVAWKAGGPWPVNELRIWNRSRAEKVIGEGSLLTRLRGKIMSLFGKD
jgi:hypothetical protein